MDSQAGPRSLRELSESRVLIFNDGYRTKQAELGTPGFPILRVAQVRDGFIESDDSFDFVRVEFRGKIGPKLAQAGDIVVSTKGTVGRRARLEIDQPYVYSPQVCFFRVLDPGVLDPDYLYYWLGSRPFLGQIDGLKAQTDMAEYVNLRDLARIQLDVPPIRVQRRIASVLRALDDKIELNRRMNQTLEAMARAFFKSWFVDFDPVRARMNGRHPLDLDAQAADLFPDSFEDSTLGPIPRGWGVCLIGDVVTVVGGSTPSTNEPSYWGGDTCFMTPRDMASLDSPILLDSERRITQAGLERISSGLLPTGTVLLSSRAPIGYLAIAEVPVAVNQGIIAMVCDLLLPNDYVLHWTRENLDVIIANANGSTFLEISKRNFRPIPVVVPPVTLLTHFVEKVRPLHSRMTINLQESRLLAQVRDAILPKFMSGRIRPSPASVRDEEEAPIPDPASAQG